MADEPVKITYFSDILCIWAYIAQARLDEVRKQFDGAVEIESRFLAVFGNVEHKIVDGWHDRGGLAGYGEHVRKVAAGFPHVEVHPDIWKRSVPTGSGSIHLFLAAVRNLCSKRPGNNSDHLVQSAAWLLRKAFFRDGIDISRLDQQLAVTRNLDIAETDIREEMESGRAMAALCRDLELAGDLAVSGSPTFVLNDGRQKLYGNVGYRIIEANIQELLNRPAPGASWC